MKSFFNKLKFPILILFISLSFISCGGGGGDGGSSTTGNNPPTQETGGTETPVAETQPDQPEDGYIDPVLSKESDGLIDTPEWAFSYFADTEPAETEIQRSARVKNELQALFQGKSGKSTEGVPAIIKLKDSFVPEGFLSDEQKISQKNRISGLQNSFIAKARTKARAVDPNLEKIDGLPIITMTITENDINDLAAESSIYSVEENKAHEASLSESSPLVEATAAWNAGYRGNGQHVAILDTGVDKTHPFLSGKVVSEACYSNSANTGVSLCPGGVKETTAAGSGVQAPSNVSGYDHGTHVAGIAAGTSNTYKGVAHDAKIIAIQVFTNVAGKALAYDSDLIKALQRVLALKNTYAIASVNMSLGGGKYTAACDSTAMKTAVDNLRSAGIATVIASGNNAYTDSVSYPACISTAIAVGSTGDGSYGAAVDVVSSYSNSSSLVDLLAPGQYIISSVPGTIYGNKSGTSMATPHVAGAFAVLKSASGTASVDEMENALKTTGKTVTDSRNNITKPRIKVNTAISSLGKGSVSVTITPSNIGAKWRVDSGAWKNSGDTVSNVYLGSHKIYYSSVVNSNSSKVWITPAASNINIGSNGASTNSAATYAEANKTYIPADLNSDGKSDLIFRSPADGSFALYTLNDKTVLDAVKIRDTNNNFVTAAVNTWDVAGIADSDGDGKSDILLRHRGNGTTMIWKMNGATRASQAYSAFYSGSNTSMPNAAWIVAGFADVNADGKADIIFRHRTNGSFYIMTIDRSTVIRTGYVRNSSGTVFTPSFSTWPVAVVADINGDKKSDIVLRNVTNGNYYAYLLNEGVVIGNGYLKNPNGTNIAMPPAQWLTVGAGDTNGDGRADIILRNKTNGSIYVLTMNGTNVASQGYVKNTNGANLSPSYATWVISNLLDTNGDLKADIVFRNTSNGNIYIYNMSDKTVSGGGYVKNSSGTSIAPQTTTWATIN